MTDTETNYRPYAATANVLAVLDRVRSRNLPESLDHDFLRITGVPEVVFGRVSQALLFLDLMHEDGRPTEKLQAMAGAGEDEFRALLADCLRAAYRPDFERIDPEKDIQPTMIDAFQRYEPRSQTKRMVMLFLGLCRASGIPVLEAPRERKMQPKSGGARPTQKARVTGTQRSANGTVKAREIPVPPDSGLLFGVSEEDIALLDDREFKEVWDALGKVARKRAAKTATPDAQPPDTGADNKDA